MKSKQIVINRQRPRQASGELKKRVLDGLLHTLGEAFAGEARLAIEASGSEMMPD